MNERERAIAALLNRLLAQTTTEAAIAVIEATRYDAFGRELLVRLWASHRGVELARSDLERVRGRASRPLASETV
jgi:hypothetical protein